MYYFICKILTIQRAKYLFGHKLSQISNTQQFIYTHMKNVCAFKMRLLREYQIQHEISLVEEFSIFSVDVRY